MSLKSPDLDLQLVTPTKTFSARRAVLAAHSPVFAAETGSLIEIDGFDDPVVEGMLEFLQTGKTEKLPDFSTDLLGIAEKYKLVDLKTECEHFIASHLMIWNAADVLHLAVLNKAQRLKSATIRYIKRNKKRVSETESFKKLSESHPSIVLELYLSNYI